MVYDAVGAFRCCSIMPAETVTPVLQSGIIPNVAAWPPALRELRFPVPLALRPACAGMVDVDRQATQRTPLAKLPLFSGRDYAVFSGNVGVHHFMR